MASETGLLSLPAELQVQIATHLLGDGKRSGGRDGAADVTSLGLTCQRLAPVAREALCAAPVLQSRNVALLLGFLFAHPGLARKMTRLTIETSETRQDKAYPQPVAHLAPVLLRNCKRHVRTLALAKHDQDTLIAGLKRARFADHGVLLALLLSMLPRLSRLFLGGSILLNFPFLRAVVPNEPAGTPARKPDWAPGPDHTWLVSLLGSRLTHLELPVDLRRSVDANLWAPLSIARLPDAFPQLLWLSIPHMTATELTRTTCADVIPPRLASLVLTDARCACFAAFSRGLVDERTGAPSFPSLARVALFHRYAAPGMDAGVVRKLAGAGIRLEEYHPACCLRSGDEFFHPWKYAADEIGRREAGRHEAYRTEWERDELLCADVLCESGDE